LVAIAVHGGIVKWKGRETCGKSIAPYGRGQLAV